MSDILTWLEVLTGSIFLSIAFLIPFCLPVLVSLIFFIAYLKRFRQTPEEETEPRKIYRKCCIVSLVFTLVLAVISSALFVWILSDIANM